MARPAKNLATVAQSGEVLDPAQAAEDAFNIPGIDDVQDISLETTLMQLGEEGSDVARVIIYRIVKESGKPIEEWLKETTPDAFNNDGIEGIARDYGAGQYRVRVFVPGERGFRANKMIRVGAGSPAAAGMVVQQQNNSELVGVMMTGFQKLGEMIVAQQKPAATEEDMLRKMAMYKELFAPAQSHQPASNPLDNMTNMMEMFKQGMELGRMGGGEPSSMDALMKGLEVFGPIAQQIAAKAPAQTAASSSVMLTAPQSPVQSSENPDMNVRAMMLKQALAFLVTQARKGADPYTYANVVMDQLDDNELSALINRPDWLDWLAGVNPDVKTPGVVEWFSKLREEIKGLLTESAEESISGTHATIEPANPSPEVVPAPDK